MKFGTASGHAHMKSLAVPSPVQDWIGLADGAPYFETEGGRSWTPIGYNEAITWPNLAPLHRRRDPAAVERHFARLRDSGVTCLRLMLDYNQVRHRHFESRCGQFAPAMVQLWDDLIALGELYGIRYLLTPFDTFFMARRWRTHPYSRANGGPCGGLDQTFNCPQTRDAIKNRLAFATRRWGHSGAIFGWDLWNEIDTSYAGGDIAVCHDFISDISAALRAEEMALHGRSHLQTVSVFGPALKARPDLGDIVFRHPALDFASIHLYEKGTIDNPRNTLAPARATARLMTEALRHCPKDRPLLDTEHGPIHAFKDRHITLPDAFDTEYFRRMQWAHLASGGAGGGMRWPNRHPHVLTQGMYDAQRLLSEFLPSIDWRHFGRTPLDARLTVHDFKGFAVGCGDDTQALVCLMPDQRACGAAVALEIAGLRPGVYGVTQFNPLTGESETGQLQTTLNGDLAVLVSSGAKDIVLAVVRSD
jgi:mannan endo-1,4-beta-mannosidase